VFFAVQAIVQFADGMTLAGIALSVAAGGSVVAGLVLFSMRNVVAAPSWSADPVESTGPSGTVIVRRPAAPLRDRLRAYQVVVDDTVIGAVRDGEEIHCTIPAGPHVIRIKLDRSGSQPRDFTMGAGQTVLFLCAPNGSGSSALLDLLLRRPWIDLREGSAP